MSNKYFLVFLAFLFSVSVYSQHGRHRSSLISGRVMSTEKEVVDFATVYLKGTNQGCYTDEKGIYHLKTTAGEYTLVVSAIGYQTVEKKVKLAKGERIKVNVTIAPAVKELGEVLVTTSGVGRVNQSAFNAVAIDAKKLHNSTQTLAGALTKVPGVKLRESGGVGSDMQLYIDGFSGKHVINKSISKRFIVFLFYPCITSQNKTFQISIFISGNLCRIRIRFNFFIEHCNRTSCSHYPSFCIIFLSVRVNNNNRFFTLKHY